MFFMTAGSAGIISIACLKGSSSHLRVLDIYPQHRLDCRHDLAVAMYSSVSSRPSQTQPLWPELGNPFLQPVLLLLLLVEPMLFSLSPFMICPCKSALGPACKSCDENSEVEQKIYLVLKPCCVVAAGGVG